jgi:UDP-glucuronate 4-epimerase
VRILITGGAGFIGSHVAERLLARGDAVTVLDNFDPYYDPKIKWRNISACEDYTTFALVEADIRDRAAVDSVLSRTQYDCVVHLAAQAGVRASLADPLYYNDVNVNGTLVLLESIRGHGSPRLVMASTSSVYGLTPRLPFSEDDPLEHCISPYGVTKIACEKFGHMYHHVYGLSVVMLRFFTVYGPRQRPDMAIHKFARAILRGDEIPIFGDGSTSRDYTYIDDIAHGVIAAVGSDIALGTYNLGNSYTTTLSDLVALLERSCGMSAKVRRMEEQVGDPPHTCADINRARAALGYGPRILPAEGIPLFVSWLKSELATQTAGGRG